MKKSKWFTGVAVLALSTGLALAAPHGEGHGRHDKGAFGEEMAQKLNLTDAQKAQIKDISKSFREQNKATFESFRATMKDYRAAKEAGDTAKVNALQGQFDAAKAQMKSLRDQLDAKIATVLTPEQNAQWQQLKAERAAKRQQWERK